MGSLDGVLADLGIVPRDAVTGVSCRGLPSPLAVGECAVSAVSGCLTAAAELMEARTGHRPRVDLDPDHVAAVVRSEFWLRDGAGRGVGGFAPLSRLWPVADGWVRTHANYPWHRRALLAAFGVPDGDDAAVEPLLGAALAGMGAADIERHAYDSGALAVAARTAQQWRGGEPGAAVAAERLVASEYVGDVARPLPAAGPLPASGLRVLDLTRVIAGPAGTRMLAALGAEVLRIDPPDRPELSVHAVDGVIGKASTILDASTPQGREIVDGLLARADVLVTGYRPGSLARLGLEPDQVAERHPHLVVASLSAWGRGRWQHRRGFDSLVQIASGIGHAVSADGDRPGTLPCQLLDHATGYLLAAGVLAALARRARTGRVAHVRLSLARTAAWLLDQPTPAVDGGPMQSELQAAAYRVPLGDGWTAIAPPGRLDGRALSWPHLPPRYGAAAPAWGAPAPP